MYALNLASYQGFPYQLTALEKSLERFVWEDFAWEDFGWEDLHVIQ